MCAISLISDISAPMIGRLSLHNPWCMTHSVHVCVAASVPLGNCHLYGTTLPRFSLYHVCIYKLFSCYYLCALVYHSPFSSPYDLFFMMTGSYPQHKVHERFWETLGSAMSTWGSIRRPKHRNTLPRQSHPFSVRMNSLRLVASNAFDRLYIATRRGQKRVTSESLNCLAHVRLSFPVILAE